MLLSLSFLNYGPGPARVAVFNFAPTQTNVPPFYEGIAAIPLTEGQWRIKVARWFADVDFQENNQLAATDAGFIRTPEGDYWISYKWGFVPPTSTTAAPNQTSTHNRSPVGSSPSPPPGLSQ